MKKVFWGLFFILSGAFVVIDHFYNYTGISINTILLTILLVAIFLKSLGRPNFFGIFFSIATLGILYSKQLHLEDITPYPILLAAFLASIGFSILFSKHRFCGVYHIHKDDGFDKTINEKDDESVNVDVSFGSTIKYVNTENFKVANLKSSFGSMEVYFDNAKIKEDSAVIKLDVSFSGVEIYLPREWKVINKVDTTLGGIEIKNNSNEKTTKTVTIKGRISFGGVEIHYI